MFLIENLEAVGGYKEIRNKNELFFFFLSYYLIKLK